MPSEPQGKRTRPTAPRNRRKTQRPPFPPVQVWVVVLSNLIAIQLQTLAARLGLVTGKNLAQVCVCFHMCV